MSGISLVQAAQIALLLVLLAVFLVLVFSLFRPGAREAARRDASSPFCEDGKDGA